MPAKQELLILINGKSKNYEDALKKAKKQTESFGKSLDKIAKVGSIAFLGISGVIIGATARFKKFETTFSNVLTLLTTGKGKTKELTDTINGLRAGIFELRAESGESFDALNKGLFDIVSASVPAEDAIDTLRAATQLAAAGATDAATATKALISATTAYGESAGSARVIAEKFFLAQKFAVSTVGELATEFNKVAANAKAVGISFDEALAAASALTANGAKPATIAFTEFRALLTGVLKVQERLTDFSPEIQKALSLQNVRQKGLTVALNETKKAVGGNVLEFKKLFPNIRAFSAAISLTGAQSKLAAKIIREMGDDVGRAAVFAEALALKQATLEKAIARAVGALDSFVVMLGAEFAPAIVEAADATTKAVKSINAMDAGTRTAIATLLKWAAAITGGVTALVTFLSASIGISAAIQGMIAAFGGGALAAGGFWAAVTGPIGIAVAGLIAVGVGAVALFNIFRDGEETATSSLEEITAKLDELKTKQAELNKVLSDASPIQKRHNIILQQKAKELALIDEEIKKLEELKRAQIGTGELVLKGPKGPLAPLPFQQPEAITIPFLPGAAPVAPGADLDKLKKDEDAKNKVISQAIKDRIQDAENASEILAAISDDSSKQEITFIKEHQEIKKGLEVAARIDNETLRDLEIENLETRKELLLEKEKEFAEEKALLFEENRLLALDATTLDLQLDSDIKAKSLIKEEKIRAQAHKNLQIEDKKHKKITTESSIADIKASIARKKAADAQIVQLERTKTQMTLQIGQNALELARATSNKESMAMFVASKLLALAQIAISRGIAMGAIFAQTHLIPAPANEFAAARLATLININAGLAATTVGVTAFRGMHEGGIVPNTPTSIPGRDSVPALLTANELVIPEDEAPTFIEAAAAVAREEEGETITRVEISMKDEAGEMFDAIVTERRALGISSI